MIAKREPCEFFDLENPVDLRRLSAPMTTLGKLSGLVVLDEVQRRPDLFELLRVLVDRPDSPVRFLLLGWASPRIVRGVSESLAGRIGFIDLSGFDLRETGAELDLLVTLRGKRYGFEFNYADAPGITRSMRVAVEDLGLEKLWVVYPGGKDYELSDVISIVPLNSLPRLAEELTGS